MSKSVKNIVSDEGSSDDEVVDDEPSSHSEVEEQGDDFQSDDDQEDIEEVEISSFLAGAIPKKEANFIVIPPSEHRSSDILTIFERTMLMVQLIKNINLYGNACVTVPILPGDDATSIANRTINTRKCGYNVKRVVGQQVIKGKLYDCVEYKDPNVMIHAQGGL